MKKIALIPSYEPDNRLIEIVKELKNKFEVIVVNDGSGSNYDEIFNNIKPFSKVIEYSSNQGKGHALKTGYQYIKDNYKNYVVVTLDSDGQHTVKDAIKLCEYAMKHPNELVIGKRLRNKKIPLRSKIGNEFTKTIYYLVTGVKVYDTQTGLRCFTNKLMDFNCNVQGERFEYEMNVLLYAPLEKIKITEIEIETIYIENNSSSHFHALKDSFRIYKEIIKFSLSSIICFLLDYFLYSIFIIYIKNITYSNILARIISASINYFINKKIVFKSQKDTKKTLIKYSLLAILILFLNTLLLNGIIIYLGINKWIAKIIIEVLLFMISWIVQKRKIF